MHPYGRAPRAPAHTPSQINRAVQDHTRSRTHNNDSHWSNQRFELFEHGLNTPDQRRSFHASSNSNFNAGQSFHASSFSQPKTQADEEAYATRLQEKLYDEDLDRSSSVRTGPSVTELEPGEEHNSNIQPEPYTVEEPDSGVESCPLSGEEDTRVRQEGSNGQRSKPLEPEQIYAAKRRRVAPRRSSYAWNSADGNDIHNQLSQAPRQKSPSPGYTRSNQSSAPPRSFSEYYGRKTHGKRPYKEFQDANPRAQQQIISYDRRPPSRGSRKDPKRPQKRQPTADTRHSVINDVSLSPAQDDSKVVSKRARKAAKVIAEHGHDTELGADGKPKGLVRHEPFANSTTQWLNKDGEAWTPAVYHYQLRPKYIDQQDPQDQFDVPRAQGHHPQDITTSHPLWKNWVPDRKDGWQGIQAEVLLRFERRGYRIPTYTPGTLMDEGRVVLDIDNHPIKDWVELPLCLSSALDGSDIETVRRLNPNITMIDIRARMPPTILMGPKKDKIVALFGTSALGNRTTRFRERNACPAWIERTGSDRLKSLVWSKMSEEQREANSTEGLEMLTELELAELKNETKGKFLERAGSRALSEEERSKRRAVAEQKLSKLRQEAEVQQGESSQKGKRSYVVMADSDEEEPTNDTKRHKNTKSIHDDFVNPVRQKAPYVAEDILDGEPSLSSYQQEGVFSSAAFRGSGYRPPISYQTGPQPATQSKVNSIPIAGGSVGTSRPNLDFGDAVPSFPPNDNPLMNLPTNPSKRKRRYGEEDSFNEKLVESEPKRREMSPRSDAQGALSREEIAARWILNRRKERQSRALARFQQPDRNLQYNTQIYHPFDPADIHNGVAQLSSTARDHPNSGDNDHSENSAKYQYEEPTSYDDLVLDAAQGNRVNTGSDGGSDNGLNNKFDNECDSGVDNNAAHPRAFDNCHMSLPEAESTHGNSPLHTHFQTVEEAPQGYQVTPILEQGFDSSTMTNPSSNSDMESQTPSSNSSYTLGNLAVDNGTRQSISFPDDYLRTIRTQEMASQHERELNDMSPFFDFAAASEAEGGHNTTLYSAPIQPQVPDYRFIEPVTEIDQHYISAALWYTRAQVKEYTGTEVTTSPWKTYRQQWEEVVAAFVDLWSLPDRPQLIYLQPWYRSFEDWPTPQISNERFDALFCMLKDGAPVPRHFPVELYGFV